MIRLITMSFFLFVFSFRLLSWSDHPIIARYALSGLPVWESADSVDAKSLKTFLVETQADLALFLEKQEQWSRAQLPNYMPRPDGLAFKAGLDHETIVERFFHAVRMNPNSKVPLYLFLMPDEPIGHRRLADPAEITTLRNLDDMYKSTYVWVEAVEKLHPLDVLTTANNEPDYGFDLGLFEDNQTAYGAQYGFGKQPFGNPNLEYSSQAPFHMGFYHEAKILYTFGPFLKHTFLDYRVNLFRDLTIFAFENNQAYWGWRFLGWSMHYASDASMPYHCKPLPGYSVLRMIWINLKAMLGFPKSRDNAVQLVSNKHTIIEAYQWQEMRRAYRANESNHLFFMALQNPASNQPFTHSFIQEIVSHRAAADARDFDNAIKGNMPPYMVSDPAIEVSVLPGIKQMTTVVRHEMGSSATGQLNKVIARRFSDLSMTIRSLMESVLYGIDSTGNTITEYSDTDLSLQSVDLSGCV